MKDDVISRQEAIEDAKTWVAVELDKEDPCCGCDYLGESCVGEGCGKLTERKNSEAK